MLFENTRAQEIDEDDHLSSSSDEQSFPPSPVDNSKAHSLPENDDSKTAVLTSTEDVYAASNANKSKETLPAAQNEPESIKKEARNTSNADDSSGSTFV